MDYDGTEGLLSMLKNIVEIFHISLSVLELVSEMISSIRLSHTVRTAEWPSMYFKETQLDIQGLLQYKYSWII